VSIKDSIGALQNLVSLSSTTITPGTGAKYVFAHINPDWDPSDHPRNPNTGEFVKGPIGFIFGKTKTASFGVKGQVKKIDLKPGDVAFKTPAGNVVVSHPDGSYSLHHGLNSVSNIPAGNHSTVAASVQDGVYQKIGENPGITLPTVLKAKAAAMLENPSDFDAQGHPVVTPDTETQAEPTGTSVPADPEPEPQAAVHSAWDVPKPTLKPGKTKFTAKQYAEYQQATLGLPMYPDKNGTPIKSGDWVEFDGKPVQVFPSPYGTAAGGKSDFGFTAYRWVATKQQASNLEKEDFFHASDTQDVTVIPDPTGKPYVPIGQEAPTQEPGSVLPKHGSIMAQAVTGSIPNTATAHKKHVESQQGQPIVSTVEHEGNTHPLIVTDKNLTPLKSGDWVEIDGKPFQIHASPNEGNVSLAKWVSTKQQASNNTYDFPATAILDSGLVKIEDPTGKPYVPLKQDEPTPEPEPASEPEPSEAEIAVAKADLMDWLKGGAITDKDLPTMVAHGEPAAKIAAQQILDAMSENEILDAPAKSPDVPDDALADWEKELLGIVDESVMHSQPVGTVAQTDTANPVTLVKQADDTWAVMEGIEGDWHTVSDSTAATMLGYGGHEHDPAPAVQFFAPDSAESKVLLDNPALQPWDKQVTHYSKVYQHKNGIWYAPSDGETVSGDDADTLNDNYEQQQAMREAILAMEPGDELHGVAKPTNHSAVQDILFGVSEDFSVQNLGIPNSKQFDKETLADSVVALLWDMYDFSIKAKGESTEDLPPKGQQFVHPVSGVVFPLLSGTKVYKHEKIENVYIVHAGSDMHTPIIFFGQNGKAQKPKASHKGFEKWFKEVDDWPGKVDEPGQPTIVPGTAATPEMVEDAQPGDQVALHYQNGGSLATMWEKQSDGGWIATVNGGATLAPTVETTSVASWVNGNSLKFAYTFYPKGSSPEGVSSADQTPEVSPWGGDDATGTAQMDPEPVSTKPAPKGQKKPALPKSVTKPDGTTLDLKPGEMFAKTVDEWGNTIYVHVTAGPKTNQNGNHFFHEAGTAAYWHKAVKWTPTSLQSWVKKNGGEILGSNVLPPAEKVDYSQYPAQTFDKSDGKYGVANYVYGAISQFGIKNYSYNPQNIYPHSTYAQFDDKPWKELDTQQQLALIADYENVAGAAVASLDGIGSLDLDKGEKQQFGKQKTGFALIHRIAILARELGNPDTEWDDDKFDGEIAFVASKVAKPGVSLSSVVADKYPLLGIHSVLQNANTQRKFKNSIADLDFDPYNGTTAEYDAFAKSKGFNYLAAMTEDMQKAWVLNEIGDPTLPNSKKAAAAKAAQQVKVKISVAELAATLDKEHNGPSLFPAKPKAKGLYAKSRLKNEYRWTNEHGHKIEAKNIGSDEWQITDETDTGNKVSFETTDAAVINLVNGALADGLDVDSSDENAYGTVSLQSALDKWAIKYDVTDWTTADAAKLSAIIAGEGGTPSGAHTNTAYLRQWIWFHAYGDEIGKYTVEKQWFGGNHPNFATHPGSPDSPIGQAAHKALAEVLSSTSAGQKWLSAGWGNLNATDQTELNSLFGFTGNHTELGLIDGISLWDDYHDNTKLNGSTSTVAVVNGKAVKPGDVPDEAWVVASAAQEGSDLSALFPSDDGIGTLTDEELTAALSTSSAAANAGLISPLVGGLPVHVKRLAVWAAGDTENDPYRTGVLKAIAAKAKAGEYLDESTPAWVAPGGAKYPLSPGSSVYKYSDYYGEFYLVTGPPDANGNVPSPAWKFKIGDDTVAPAKFNFNGAVPGEHVFTMPAPVQFDQAQKAVPNLTKAYWDESELIEAGQSKTFTHHEVGAVLTASLKKNTVLQKEYPHLYAQHKTLPENVRQAVLFALDGYTPGGGTSVMLDLLEYKASKGHFNAMTTKGLFDSGQPWLKNLSRGQMDEDAVTNKWSPEAKDAYVGHFQIGGWDEIASHLDGLLNPKTEAPTKALPKFEDLKLTFVRKKSVGAHSGSIWADHEGNEWMSKAFASDPNGKMRVDAEAEAMSIGRLFGFRNPVSYGAPIGPATGGAENSYAYLQHFAPATGDLLGKGPLDLTTKQLSQAMEEHVLDWIISNHDTHPQNLMIDPNGNVFGIDKGQAFKHFPNDKLAVGYRPSENPVPVWYDQFYEGVLSGKISKDLADEVTKAVLRRAQKISKDKDDEFRAHLEVATQNRTDYPSAHPTREQFIDALVERKHNAFDDFVSFYKDLYAKSPYEFDIDTENLLPPKLDEHTHISASNDYAADVLKSGVHGKALFFNSVDLEDSHILSFIAKEHDGSNTLIGDAKIRAAGDKALEDWLSKQTVHYDNTTATQTNSYNDYDSTPSGVLDPAHLPGNTEYFSAMVSGSKTVSHHNAEGNHEYNQATLNKMDGALVQIENALEKLKAWKADNPSTPFKGTVDSSIGFVPIVVDLHTMEQQAAWEKMLETYAGYAEKVNAHKGTDQKISPHFTQVTYTPSPEAIALTEAKQNAGKNFHPFTKAKIVEILEKAKNGDQITYLNAFGEAQIYTKVYGGWESGPGEGKVSSETLEKAAGQADKTGWAYTDIVPGVPADGPSAKTWANQQDEGAEITVVKPDGTTAIYQKVEHGKWRDAVNDDWMSPLMFEDYAKEQGWKFSDVKTAEEAGAESSSTIKVGTKTVKVTKKKNALRTGQLNLDTGDLTLAEKWSNKYYGTSLKGDMYEIDFGDTTIVYHTHDSGNAITDRGKLRFEKRNWDGDETSLNEIFDLLRQMGLNLNPASEESMELFYWRQVTGVVSERKEKSYGQYATMLAEIKDGLKPGLSDAEMLEVYREAWAKVIGADRVQNADWMPKFSRTRIHALKDEEDRGFSTGRPYWFRPDITMAEMRAKNVKAPSHNVTYGGDNSSFYKIAMSGALFSAEEKYRLYGASSSIEGQSSFATSGLGGVSPESDYNSHGSSSQLFMYAGNPNGGNLLLHPRVMMRTTNYVASHDSFGDQSQKLSSPWDAEALNSSSNYELMTKNLLSVMDDIGMIIFPSATLRDEAIKEYKSRGINEIHGLPIEKVFALNDSERATILSKLWDDAIAEEAERLKEASAA
jgi:hypothetical protein